VTRTRTPAEPSPAEPEPAPTEPAAGPPGPAIGTAAGPADTRRGGHPADEGEAQRPAATPVQPPRPSTSGLPQFTRILGAIVAPTTLLTSLLFYFGWSRAYWFYIYFGVNSTLLDLTTRDYLQISFDALFVPLTVVALAGLLVLWGHAALRVRLTAGSESRLIRVGIPAMAAAGAILATAGLWSVWATTRLDRYLAVAPLSLALGVVLLVYAGHLWRLLTAANAPAGRAAAPPWVAVAEWAVVFVLVGLSLFWAATDYSAAVGRGRAQDALAALPGEPNAVIYSERSLSLHAPGVRETRCQDPEAAYRYRYDGLKLVLQSGGQYLFLPAGWTSGNGVAILMPRSDSLRLEFTPPAAGTPRRPSC
jgi:hypothetical protein